MTTLLWAVVAALIIYTIRLHTKLSVLQDDYDFVEDEINQICQDISDNAEEVVESFEVQTELNDMFASTFQSILNTLENAKLTKKIVSKKVATKKVVKKGKK